MCCGLVGRKVILIQALLSVCQVDVYSIYLFFLYISYTSYILGAQKSRFSEMVLLRTHNMCCGLVERRGFCIKHSYLCVRLMLTQLT